MVGTTSAEGGVLAKHFTKVEKTFRIAKISRNQISMFCSQQIVINLKAFLFHSNFFLTFQHRQPVSQLCSSTLSVKFQASDCYWNFRQIDRKEGTLASVWPDWKVFESSWWKKFSQSCPNAWWLFGLFWKTSLFKLKIVWIFLENFYENLGYFWFQHLVTLPSLLV